MSLDIYLKSQNKIKKTGTGIFARVNGETKELPYEDAVKMYPGNVIKMNTYETNEVWSGNITHNLVTMAEHVPGVEGHTLHEILWHPEMIFTSGVILASDIAPYIESTIINLIKNKSSLLQYNPDNGWGNYEQLLKFTINYYQACIDNPDSYVYTDC